VFTHGCRALTPDTPAPVRLCGLRRSRRDPRPDRPV